MLLQRQAPQGDGYQIFLETSVREKLNKYAIDNDTSLAAILIDSLESYLNKKEK